MKYYQSYFGNSQILIKAVSAQISDLFASFAVYSLQSMGFEIVVKSHITLIVLVP